MGDFTPVFLNGVDFNTIFLDDFLNKYNKYKEKTNINDLIDFLDNIETNKKYYSWNIILIKDINKLLLKILVLYTNR